MIYIYIYINPRPKGILQEVEGKKKKKNPFFRLTDTVS